MPEQTTTSLPGIAALAAELERAWVPAPPPRQSTQDDDDDVWEGDDCGCGGEDSYGRPICNCGDGCGCEQCHYSRHSFTRTCSYRTDDQPPGARCGKPTRYQVSGWRPNGATSVPAKDVDPNLDGERGREPIPFDERPASLSGNQTACSREHAYAIAAQRRAWANRDKAADDPDRYRFRIEQYRYEPADLDLPDVLVELRDVIRSLSYNAGELVKAGCRIPDTAANVFLIKDKLAGARRDAAKLVTALAQLDTRERRPYHWHVGDPRPEHVRSVWHGEGSDRVVYDRPTEQDVWIGFEGGRRFESWEQMLAELGEVSELPRHELVTPGEPTGWAADHDD